MRRRAFIALTAGAAAARPRVAGAQQPGKPRLIAVLMSLREDDPGAQERIRRFRDGLAAVGWIDGTTARIEYRWGGGQVARIEAYAQELVALKPDVILANGAPVIAAFQRATTTIPIIFALVIDPVRLGFVASLARPGGNITGFTLIDPELIGKWRQLLGEAAPSVRHSALLFHPKLNAYYFDFLKEIEIMTPQAAATITAAPVETIQELQSALAREAQLAGGSLVIGPDAYASDHIKEIAALALLHKLPGISVYRQFVVEGGLMSYGPDLPDIFRRAADYIDRILKGANPADLPVQQPTKFEFLINLKSAKALGLALPLSLLSAADEVIE